MSLYPESVARCQHIKVNGTQCGSPALRNKRFCYFHKEWREKRFQINRNVQREQVRITLPVFEDANSIQVALMQVTRLLMTQQMTTERPGFFSMRCKPRRRTWRAAPSSPSCQPRW